MGDEPPFQRTADGRRRTTAPLIDFGGPPIIIVEVAAWLVVVTEIHIQWLAGMSVQY